MVAATTTDDRCHLNHPSALWHSYFERRVIEIAATPSLDLGYERLINVPVESH
jgi:hypothetical protein